MQGGKASIILAAFVAVVSAPIRSLGSQSSYPEERSDLQQYQDTSKCFPDLGEWICMYRNYYSDPLFGGPSKCLTYKRFGTYENFTTPVVFTFGQNESTSGNMVLTSSPCHTAKDSSQFTPYDQNTAQENFNFIYVDCSSCVIVRHRYAANGYGCSFWRRVGTLHQPNECCEFIYAENCGTSPKYQIYDPKICDF